MATNNKTASGVPRPEATDEIDVVDIQGIADKVEDTIQNIDFVKFHTVRKLYDNTTTLLATAVKSEWTSFELNDSGNPVTAYILRVAGSQYGLALVGKVDNSNGTMLVIGINGGDYHTLTNGSWS